MLVTMAILTTQLESVAAASGTWQQHMKLAIRDTKKLIDLLGLPDSSESSSRYPTWNASGWATPMIRF
jgi:hypothetical protein